MIFLVIIVACAICENILETNVFYCFNLKEEKIRKVSSKILNLDFLQLQVDKFWRIEYESDGRLYLHYFVTP